MNSKTLKVYTAIKSNNIILLSSNLTGELLDYKPEDINIRDMMGRTPLYFTCKNKNIEFCDFLIKHGANVNEICDDKTNNTPLHIAFNTGDKFLVMYLID